MEKEHGETSANCYELHVPALTYTPDPRGLGNAFFDAMMKNRYSIAQVDGMTGEEDTYQNLLQRSIRTAIVMRKRGICSEDVITLCTYNHLNTAVPFIATLFLSAKISSLDPTLPMGDIILLIKHVKPKLLFIGPESEKLIESALKQAEVNAEIVVFGKSIFHSTFDDFLSTAANESSFRPINCKTIRETAVIFFSSGTSGFPKGICCNHLALLTHLNGIRETYRGLERILVYKTTYWISNVLFFMVGILNGSCRILLPNFYPNEIWRLIDKYKPTAIYIGAGQAFDLLDTYPNENIDTSSLRTLVLGGAHTPKLQMKELEQICPNAVVAQAYGLTESVGPLTAFRHREEHHMELLRKHPDSAGLPLFGMRYRIVDPETEEVLGPNKIGELRVKGNIFMNGYYNADSAEAWDKDGWLRTGDLVYYDSDNCFYIVDRIKEMLKFRSWHVTPASLEVVLQSHPNVLKSVVIGIPHERDGDHPMAIVVLKASKRDSDAKEIENFVEERVHDRQRLRAGVKIVDDLPAGPSGKINRKHIRDMVLKQQL